MKHYMSGKLLYIKMTDKYLSTNLDVSTVISLQKVIDVDWIH